MRLEELGQLLVLLHKFYDTLDDDAAVLSSLALVFEAVEQAMWTTK